MRKTYPTDLSDAEWSYIEPLLPIPKAPGRPRVHPLREVLNAIPTFMCVVQASTLDDAQGG
jgi:transposase